MKSITYNHVKRFLSALGDLLELKGIIREITPTYALNDEIGEEFNRLLTHLQNQLEPLFQAYLHRSYSNDAEKKNQVAFLTELKEMKPTILVSSSTSKKLLKKLGFDPQNIIVTGGPLIFEDYKKINPDLSEEALSGIKRKCDNIINLLQRAKVQTNKLYFIYESQNQTDKIIINEIEIIKSSIGKDLQSYDIISWKEVAEHSDL